MEDTPEDIRRLLRMGLTLKVLLGCFVGPAALHIVFGIAQAFVSPDTAATLEWLSATALKVGGWLALAAAIYLKSLVRADVWATIKKAWKLAMAR